jgi:hypothetical protein
MCHDGSTVCGCAVNTRSGVRAPNGHQEGCEAVMVPNGEALLPESSSVDNFGTQRWPIWRRPWTIFVDSQQVPTVDSSQDAFN